MKLIDTSSWIHQIRGSGDTKVRARVEQLLLSGDAAWCPVIRLELWAGVGSDTDRRVLHAYQERIPELPVTNEIWDLACRLADRCRRAGLTVPPNDVLIAACGRHYGLEIEHEDSHFDLIAKVPL